MNIVHGKSEQYCIYELAKKDPKSLINSISACFVYLEYETIEALFGLFEHKNFKSSMYIITENNTGIEAIHS